MAISYFEDYTLTILWEILLILTLDMMMMMMMMIMKMVKLLILECIFIVKEEDILRNITNPNTNDNYDDDDENGN